jgi:hypothetical protein
VTRENSTFSFATSSSASFALSSPSADPFSAIAFSSSRALAAPEGRSAWLRATSDSARASCARRRATSPSERSTAASYSRGSISKRTSPCFTVAPSWNPTFVM